VDAQKSISWWKAKNVDEQNPLHHISTIHSSPPVFIQLIHKIHLLLLLKKLLQQKNNLPI